MYFGEKFGKLKLVAAVCTSQLENIEKIILLPLLLYLMTFSFLLTIINWRLYISGFI